MMNKQHTEASTVNIGAQPTAWTEMTSLKTIKQTQQPSQIPHSQKKDPEKNVLQTDPPIEDKQAKKPTPQMSKMSAPPPLSLLRNKAEDEEDLNLMRLVEEGKEDIFQLPSSTPKPVKLAQTKSTNPDNLNLPIISSSQLHHLINEKPEIKLYTQEEHLMQTPMEESQLGNATVGKNESQNTDVGNQNTGVGNQQQQNEEISVPVEKADSDYRG